jgi:hypothetical protein
MARSTGFVGPNCHASACRGLAIDFHQPKPHGTFKLIIGGGLHRPIATFQLAILPSGLSRSIGQQTSGTHLLRQKQLIACEHHQHNANLPLSYARAAGDKSALIVINFAEPLLYIVRRKFWRISGSAPSFYQEFNSEQRYNV